MEKKSESQTCACTCEKWKMLEYLSRLSTEPLLVSERLEERGKRPPIKGLWDGWINVNERLPNQIERPLNFTIDTLWVWDGIRVFLSEWLEIDVFKKEEKDLYKQTNGKWFGYVDGTECFAAHKNILAWRPLYIPHPPEELDKLKERDD